MEAAPDKEGKGADDVVWYFQRNTFIEARPAGSATMRRSVSDSDLSGTTSTSLSSGSNGQSFHRCGIQGKGGGQGDLESSSGSNDPSSGVIGGTRGQADGGELSGDELTEGTAALSVGDANTAAQDLAFLEAEFALLEAEAIVPPSMAADLRSCLPRVPKDPRTGQFTSIGSIGHPDGCRPCNFWYKGACHKSVSCNYCHFIHKGQKSKVIRPSKWTRMQRKQNNEQGNQGEQAAVPAGSGSSGLSGASQRAPAAYMEAKAAAHGQRFNNRVSL